MYIFKDLEYGDSVAVNRMLKATGNTDRTSLKTLLRSIEDDSSMCVILQEEESLDIVGIWCSTKYENYISLTFFYLVPQVRRKLVVMDFFKHCMEQANPKQNIPVYIHARDISTFERYVVPVEGMKDTYMFVGFKNRRKASHG